MKKILIGVDESKYAVHAIEYGFKLAHQLKADVGLVHIIEPVGPQANTIIEPGIGMSVDAGADMYTVDMINIQDERGKKLLDTTAEKYGKGLQVAVFEEYGTTAEGIINCSKEFHADMIVIGTHSRTGIDRFLMGSVAEHVVRHSEIPVLVVPMKHE